jgi:hypothetical protein
MVFVYEHGAAVEQARYYDAEGNEVDRYGSPV